MHSFEARDAPEIYSVWLWFGFQNALIWEARGRVFRMFQPGQATLPKLPDEMGLTGLTYEEVVEFFDAQAGRLELLTMFELLATTEAILRIDFKTRVAGKKRDGLSKRFRELQRDSGDAIRLDEDILAAMKGEGVPAKIVAEFRGALKLRHWLAHGRHWHPKLGRGYSPADVFNISTALIRSIPPI